MGGSDTAPQRRTVDTVKTHKRCTMHVTLRTYPRAARQLSVHGPKASNVSCQAARSLSRVSEVYAAKFGDMTRRTQRGMSSLCAMRVRGQPTDAPVLLCAQAGSSNASRRDGQARSSSGCQPCSDDSEDLCQGLGLGIGWQFISTLEREGTPHFALVRLKRHVLHHTLPSKMPSATDQLRPSYLEALKPSSKCSLEHGELLSVTESSLDSIAPLSSF